MLHGAQTILNKTRSLLVNDKKETQLSAENNSCGDKKEEYSRLFMKKKSCL